MLHVKRRLTKQRAEAAIYTDGGGHFNRLRNAFGRYVECECGGIVNVGQSVRAMINVRVIRFGSG